MKNNKIVVSNEGNEVPHEFINCLSKDDWYYSEEMFFLNFTGIVFNGSKVLISFPKKFIFDRKNIFSDLRLLFKVINKSKKSEQENFGHGDIETNFPFQAFSEIYNFYLQYGLYRNIERSFSDGYSGKVSWKTTISKSKVLLNGHNLIYLPLKIEKKYDKYNFITECMVYVINKVSEEFPYIFNVRKIRYEKNFSYNFDDNKLIIKLLNEYLSYMNKDIYIKLVRSLINFFKGTGGNKDYYIKHHYFSSVWENMCKFYLNNYFLKIENNNMLFSDNSKVSNDFRKRTFYPNQENESHNIQPDFYMVKSNIQYIFDAKYYKNITGINYKQIAYYYILKEYGKKNGRKLETYSALILPGDQKNRVHFKLKNEFNNDDDDFKILEIYLNVRKLMVLYCK